MFFFLLHLLPLPLIHIWVELVGVLTHASLHQNRHTALSSGAVQYHKVEDSSFQTNSEGPAGVQSLMYIVDRHTKRAVRSLMLMNLKTFI